MGGEAKFFILVWNLFSSNNLKKKIIIIKYDGYNKASYHSRAYIYLQLEFYTSPAMGKCTKKNVIFNSFSALVFFFGGLTHYVE